MLCKKAKSIIKVILPIIFIAYAISITFFTHTHIVDGVTIVHSHPYLLDENENPDHGHSGAEIQLIHILSVFFATAIIVLSIILGLLPIEKIPLPFKEYAFCPQQVGLGLFKLRPPPLL